MLNISLKQIETFVWLAALKSFRRVAEQMNTTQPNISARISARTASFLPSRKSRRRRMSPGSQSRSRSASCARTRAPAGTTAAALRALDDAGVRSGFLAAVQACHDRSAEMAR